MGKAGGGAKRTVPRSPPVDPLEERQTVAYVTVDGLKASLANAGGAGARTAAELPNGRLQANLAEAVGEVTGRLRRSYTLPDPGADANTVPDGIPGLMQTLIIGIAGYLATLEFYGSQPLEERDPVALRYARANALLTDLARGNLTIEGLEVIGGDTSSPSGDAEIYQPNAAVGLADVFDPNGYQGNPSSPAYFGGVVWE